jgi:hypothetical protein
MATLTNIVELLQRWDFWRRLEATPDRVDALERRIAELELKLKRAPGEACPKCGALEFRVTNSKPAEPPLDMLGARVHILRCGDCGFKDQRMQK